MVEIIRLDPDSIQIPEGIIAGRLGFTGEKTIPDGFKEQYQDALMFIRDTATPIAIVEDVSVEHEHGVISIEGTEIKGALAFKHLSGITRATIIIATIGEGVDKLIKDEETKGNTLASFIIDGIASEFVEFFIRGVDTILRNRPGCNNGRTRISPGYGDLPLDLNPWIVDRLDGGRFGISAVEGSCQLIPRKTVTAFIGWRDRDDD